MGWTFEDYVESTAPSGTMSTVWRNPAGLFSTENPHLHGLNLPGPEEIRAVRKLREYGGYQSPFRRKCSRNHRGHSVIGGGKIPQGRPELRLFAGRGLQNRQGATALQEFTTAKT